MSKRDVYRLEQQLRERERERDRALFELKTVRAQLAQLQRRRQRIPGSATPFPPIDEDGDEPERTERRYVVTGSVESVRTIDFLLRHMASSARYGSTSFYQLMVDGDGGADLQIADEQGPLNTTTEEEDFLWADGPRPGALRDVSVRGEEILEISVL